MDHAWAVEQLQGFLELMDTHSRLVEYSQAEQLLPEQAQEYDALMDIYGSIRGVADRLISLDPVMRELMDAAKPELGGYAEPSDTPWSYVDTTYWSNIARESVLRAIGIHELGGEARRRMRPDSPDLVAEQFHPWVWEAAAPLWYAGSRQESVHAAARSVNARMQQKRGHHDKSDAALCREFFSLDAPAPRRPRLRFSGYARTDPTWRSRQQGAMDFGAGCFQAIRNPAAHEHGLDLPEQVALEQLAAFSVLARWVDQCTVERVSAARDVREGSGLSSEAPGILPS